MKKLSFAFGLVMALGFTMNGQMLKEMFNTASNPPSYSGYRTYGAQDVAWFVAQTPFGSVSTPPTNPSAYVRAVSQDAVPVGWWNPHPSTLPNAGWITYPNTCSGFEPAYHGCLNDPTAKWGVDQWYKISFYLCCEEFCIDWDLWADNRIEGIYVNTMSNSGSGYWSNPVPGNPGTYQGYLSGNSISTSICSELHQGYNYIIVHVTSYDPNNNNDFAGLLVNTTSISDCQGIIYNLLEEDEEDTGEGKLVGLDSKQALINKDLIVLNQNVPNPFAESTVITYNIPDNFKKAQILFSGTDGFVIKEVNITQKGKGSLNVYGDDLSHGIYAYQLVVDGKIVETKKMVKQ